MAIDLWHPVHIQVVSGDRGTRRPDLVIQKSCRYGRPAHGDCPEHTGIGSEFGCHRSDELAP